METIIFGLIIIFLIMLAGFLITLRAEQSEKKLVLGGLESVLFLVMMPKNESKNEEQARKEEKMVISQMEQVLANFLYLKKPKMFQEPPSVALEIASKIGGSDISFYVCVPKYLETAFEKYVQGVYPRAIIEKTPEDYTVFEPQGHTAGAYATLAENYLFPISTYQTLEKDPLATITNNISKISANEGAAIQLIIRPSPGSHLKNKGEKALAKIREGQEARRAVSQATAGGFSALVSEAFKSGPKTEKQKELEAQKPKEQGFDQKAYDAVAQKIQKQPFETVIRLVASAQTQERAEEILTYLTSAFSQFSIFATNGFNAKEIKGSALKKFIYEFSFRIFNEKHKNLLNVEELASIYHFPTYLTQTPYIKGTKSDVVAPPADLPETGVNLLGKVLFRQEEKRVYFASREDRRRHLYVVGQTGTGKSAFLREMIRQDIESGEGVAVIDPHGELVEHTLANIPKNRIDDVMLFEPSDIERPMGLNMLEYDTPEQKDFAVQEMIAIFYKPFPPEIIGPMFEHYMRNAMLALMADKENPGTLVEIPKMFTDPAFLQERLAKVADPVVKSFWQKEWAQTTGSTKSDMLGYVVSKVGRFIENEMMRNIIGQSRSSFDLADIMDNKKIFLANLSKGKTGEVNSSLLGLILVSKMQMAALKRAGAKEADRKDFYLYIDEFQNFTTDSISTILSEARKYKLNLIIAHQYISQLSEPIKNSVFGNVGTMGAFRVGSGDAEFLEKQFEPEFTRFDLVNLDNFHVVIKMMLNNKISTPFKMQTLPPQEGRPQIVGAIKQISKLKYGKAKSIVEADILKRSFANSKPLAPPRTGAATKKVILFTYVITMINHEKIRESQELINEKDLFGQVTGEALVPGGYEGFKNKEGLGAIDQAEEMEKVKRFQPEDMASFADELHTLVCEELDIKNPNQLKFYTTVGSKLDYRFGMDGFFELNLGDGKMITVSLDGTENLYKMDHGKEGGKEADVTFLWPEDIKEENQFGWNLALENATRMIVDYLREKAGKIVNLDDDALEVSSQTASRQHEQLKRLDRIRQARHQQRSHHKKKPA